MGVDNSGPAPAAEDDNGRALREFGLRLRGTRTAAGLSQEQLAHLSGLHRTYVGSVERGERNISLLNILTLATVLSIDPGLLIQGMTRPPVDSARDSPPPVVSTSPRQGVSAPQT